MPCATGVHWVLGHFPSVVKFVWLLLIKCLRKSSVKCDSHTVLTFSLISFATSTPGMRHDTQYWENKISCCLNAMCYWSPLGFRTLSKFCQVFLTLINCFWKSSLKIDAQFTRMFQHALLLHPHPNYLEGPEFEFRGWLHQDLWAVWY